MVLIPYQMKDQAQMNKPSSSKLADLARAKQDIHTYLQDYQHREILRFVVVGSVDDGKSTLIGRLLHDTDQVFEDQLEDARRNSGQDEEIDFSLLTDGLRAEREQGITIDVAYRYFSTPRRKYIIADTPGHIQYTRNMATGASTADVAVILIDARLGIQQQSKRHAYIASLLGIKHLIVAINKMDLMDYQESIYRNISEEFSTFAEDLYFKDVLFFPVSAKMGDNVVDSSANMPWYKGKTIMEHLETVPVQSDKNFDDFRMPVQYVIRPHQDYRGFAGQISSGVVRQGDEVIVLPSMRQSRIKSIDTFDGPQQEAFPPMSVTLCLEDEVDISRGDMLAHVDNLPHTGRYLTATMVWMSSRKLDSKASYIIKHATQTVRANVEAVSWKSDPNTLEQLPTDALELNDIGEVRWVCHRPLAYDSYRKNRSTGAFILIDSLTNETMAAGMLQEPKVGEDTTDTSNQSLHEDFRIASRGAEANWTQDSKPLSKVQREAMLGQRGIILYCSSDEEDLKTLLYSVERKLLTMGHFAHAVELNEASLSAHIPSLQRFVRMGLLSLVSGPLLNPQERLHLDNELGADNWLEIVLHPESTPSPENENSKWDSALGLYRSESLSQTHNRLLKQLTRRGILSELRGK